MALIPRIRLSDLTDACAKAERLDPLLQLALPACLPCGFPTRNGI